MSVPTVDLPSPSCFQTVRDYVADYGPLVVGVLAIAGIVYKVWGEIALLWFAAGASVAYYFREQVAWLIFADSWWPALRNSIIYPFAGYLWGFPGAIASAFFNGMATLREQWRLYTGRLSLDNANLTLRDENILLQRQVEQFQAQNDALSATVNTILQICPQIGQHLNEIDVGAQELRLQIHGERVQTQEVIRQFVGEYQRMAADPHIATRLELVRKIETRLVQMAARIQDYNQQMTDILEQSRSTALSQTEVQTICHRQVQELGEILNGLRAR